MTKRLRLWVCGLAFAVAACGGSSTDDVGADADVGDGRASLEVGEPPGESLGLAFGGRQTLPVLYRDAAGQPIQGAEVEFSMRVDAGEDSGGSTLSSPSAITDEHGVAEIDLVAGAESVNFRVEAHAPNAPSATFYIAVSEDGFTDLAVAVLHEGFRDPGEILPVNLRLYQASEHTCQDIDVDDIPASVLPEREVQSLGDEASFPNRSSGEGHTVLAFGDHEEGLPPLAYGCIDLDAQQLRPGTPLMLTLVVRDRGVTPPDKAALSSNLDLNLVSDALDEAGTSEPWDTLAECEAATGQLVLDCAQGELGGADLCEPGGEDELAEALEAQRGQPDDDGCRPLDLGEGAGESLDAVITDAIAAGEFPADDELAALAAERREVLSELEIESTIELTGPDTARHRLDIFRLGIAGEPPRAIELHDTARTHLTADGVTVRESGPGSGELEIGPHAFTARLGSAAATAFRDQSLAPREVDADAYQLGTALVGAAEDPESPKTGCEAVSALACRALGEPEPCLEPACAGGVDRLDDALGDWAELLDGLSLDLSLEGIAPGRDDTGDLVLDTLGHHSAAAWFATFFLRDDTPVDLVGSMVGERIQD